MSGHAETALDQLRLADRVSERLDDDGWWERQRAHALTAAQVHALLEVATAVREAGVMAIPTTWP
jgi:hypothetical protein